MRIRGERECVDCGTRWSYYETGSITCPDCSSLQSVACDDPTQHTTTEAELDLTDVRADIETASLADLAAETADRCRAHVRQLGFIHGGEPRAPTNREFVAAELAQVARQIKLGTGDGPAVESHFLELLRGVEAGTRPDPGAVPKACWAPRAAGYATVLRSFRRELASWSRDHETGSTARRALERFDTHVTRLDQLAGPVPPGSVEPLVAASRSLATGLAGEEGDLERTLELLGELDQLGE